MKRALSWAAGVALLVIAGMAWEHSARHEPGSVAAPAAAPVEVTVAAVERRDVPIVLQAVGRTEARASVAVKPRADGVVAELAYNEGQPVRKGQLLVRLDDAVLQSQLRQAEAVTARDEALLQKSQADVRRSETLLAQGFVSASAVDQARSALHADEATLRADRAAQESVRLQLQFMRVLAPIDGVAGIAQLTVGGAVKANDTTLVTIAQVDPIYVTFTMPEAQLGAVRAALRAGPVPVDASVAGAPAVAGHVAIIDNAVDATTGAITAKAIFPNPAALLTPGQFASLRLKVGQLAAASAVPSRAVESGADSAYVFVVDDGGRAHLRPVKVTAESDGWSVLTGVAAGERVVLSGQEKVRDKAVVRIVPVVASAPRAS